MDLLIRYLRGGCFHWEFFLSLFLFQLPLRHRPHPLPKLLIGIAVTFLFQYLSIWNRGTGLELQLFLFLLAGVLMLWWCAEINLWDAIYGTVCSYAAQHIAYALFGILHTALLPQLWYFPVYLLCMGLCYFVFVRKMVLDGKYQMPPGSTVLFAIVIVLIVFFFSKWSEDLYLQDVAGNTGLFLICRLYAICCCIFVLFLQTGLHRQMQAQNALQIQHLLMENQKQQYQLSRETIQHINQKCHNLKHQVEALRAVSSSAQRNQYLNEIENSVMIYDAAVKTGNEVLDTVLTEKSLICEREGIQWTCVADGKQLAFLDPVDLYTIFGNALDNAIESVRKLENPEQRILSVTVYGKPKMAVIQIENYYEGTLKMEQGLPVTTKEHPMDHGYGIKSIREIAQKYGGSLSVDTENQIFLLSIMLPK